MKRPTIIIVLGLLMVTGCLSGQDFSEFSWGDTMEEVKAIEGKPRFTLADGTMMYYTEGGFVSFSFAPIRRTMGTTWRLVEGMQSWGSKDDGQTLKDHVEIWNRNMPGLIKQYGQPEYIFAPSEEGRYSVLWIYEDRTIVKYSLDQKLFHYLVAVPLESRKGEAMYYTYLAWKQRQKSDVEKKSEN